MHPYTFSISFTVIGAGLLWHETNGLIGGTAFSIGFWLMAYCRETD